MELPLEAIGSGGANCFSRWPVPELLRKPQLAISQGLSGPLSLPSGSAHGKILYAA